MSTTIRDAAYDDATADLVTRALRAVADATPVEDAPAATGEDSDDEVLRLAPATGQRARRRGVLVRVAAVAAAVAVVAGLVWARSDRSGDDAPTDMTDQAPPPWVRMEAGWLPPGLDGAPAIVERSAGIAEPVDAVMWGSGNHVVVAAVVDMGDDAAPDAVRRRVERVRSALESVVQPWEASLMATDVVGGRGAAVVARSGSSPDVDVVAARIADGAAPVDVAPDGVVPHRLPVTWLTGVGSSVIVGYQAADQSAAVGIAVVAGDLPEPTIIPALQPGAQPTEVRGHAGWSVVPTGSDNTWVTWEEQPGLVVTVAGALAQDDLLAVAERLETVDEPIETGARTEVAARGTVEGMEYRIESTPPEETGRGWCASLVLDDDPAGRVCQHLVDGVALTGPDVRPVATYDGGTLWWGSLDPGVAAVAVGSGVEVATIEAAVVDGEDAGLPVVLIPVPDTSGPVTFQLLGPDGENLGTITSHPPDWAR